MQNDDLDQETAQHLAPPPNVEAEEQSHLRGATVTDADQSQARLWIKGAKHRQRRLALDARFLAGGLDP